MSIATEITRLQNAKAALKSSIEAKGVTVPQDAKIDTYAELIDSIPTGGGEYEPICFTSLEDGNTFSLNKEISISVDGKKTWQTLAANTPSPAINAGEKIYFKATENAYPYQGVNYNYQFTTLKTCNVSGHPYSLYTKFSYYSFAYLFQNTKIVDASGLDLSENKTTSGCYLEMFRGCTSLVTAPELPATTIADSCYQGMFRGCTSLVTAPELPATTLANNCYYDMFQGCTSLVTAPELPATTLAINCYYYMFTECTSLVTAPELPATTLKDYCYAYMFNKCTSLTKAPELPATTLAINCYYYMFTECTSLVTAPELPATTLKDYCYAYMFNKCTSLTKAPELPATTLLIYCYYYMFSKCTSLVTAPELPATTLVNYCYGYMFDGCKKINYIKALFTTSPSTSYTGYWLYGVASTGTFVKNSAATWTTTGFHGIPKGWTVINDNA